MGEEVFNMKDFLSKQSNLPEEFNDIVNDNFWQLISTTMKTKELLLKRRNKELSEMEYRCSEKHGYFDAQDASGGNFDDCYNLGKRVGEAELIEEILPFIDNETDEKGLEAAWYDYRSEHPNSVGALMEYYEVFKYAYGRGVTDSNS